MKLRAPIKLVERFANVPDTDGWLGLDADVRYDVDTPLPEVTGHLEAHDVRVDKFSFAKEIQSDLSFRRSIVTSSKTTVKIANGMATISDVAIDISKPGFPIKAKLDVRDAEFTQLMKDLGVSQHAHVAWDIKEVHAPTLHGTLDPLHIDSDLTGKTSDFAVVRRAPVADAVRRRSSSASAKLEPSGARRDSPRGGAVSSRCTSSRRRATAKACWSRSDTTTTCASRCRRPARSSSAKSARSASLPHRRARRGCASP